MGFYDYLHGQNHKATAVAQDAAAESEKENLVTIRRVFKISPEKMKELGHEDKGEEEGEQKPNGQEESQAQDAAVAEDALSKRHSSTPLEDCKAKDPRYCPYHGAAKMTQELDEMFKQAGIYAQGGVERMKQGKYKVQYSVPPSKKDAANKLISEYLQKPGFEEFEDTDGDDVDDIAKTVKMDKKDDQFAMREEHLERLEADMKKGAKVDPSALYQLRKDHHDLKALGEAAWKARTDAGLEKESSNSNAFKDWAANNPEWKKYREAQAKFDKDYNYLRGNADLAHIEKPEDVIELMDHLNGQIDKIGTFMKAKAGIDALKKEMGLTKMPPGLEATAKYNKAMGETGLLARELSEAHKHCVEANESGDIGQQKAAAHELEIVLRNLEENKDIINDAFKAAQEFEAYLKENTAESLKAASKEAMAKKKAEKAAAEKAAAEAEAAKGGSGEEVPNGETAKGSEGGETPKTEEKPTESNGGEGAKKTYTEAELKGMFEPIQDELKKLYKDAGYDKAVDLQKQIEQATGKEVSDIPELQTAFSEAFYSGALQVMEGDGVSDMVDIYQGFDEVKTPEGLIESYKGLTKNIKDFVEKAEKYNQEHGYGESKKTDGGGKSEPSGDIYEDFLTGGHDDTATLYGDAGLSADHEYDKYVKKMDDAIEAAKDAVKNYKGDDKAGFTKKTANELKANLKAIADEQSEGATKAEKAEKSSNGGESSTSGGNKKKKDFSSVDDARDQLDKAIGGEKDGIKPFYMDESDNYHYYSLKTGDEGHIEACVSKKDGKVTFGLMSIDGGWSNESSDLNDVIKAFEENESGNGSSSSNNKTTKVSNINNAPEAPQEVKDAAKAAGITSVKPDTSVKYDDGNTDDLYILGTKGEGTLEAIVKKDKDGKITSISYGVQDNDNFHFESHDLAEVNKLFESEYGEKKSDSKSEPKSAASQYTANLNKGKKSKSSAAKPTTKKTTKDVATGDPMVDGIVSTAFNFVKSGKKATTIPLPEDVPYSKIAKALKELGCETAMSGEPDSKGYGIVVSPPKED